MYVNQQDPGYAFFNVSSFKVNFQNFVMGNQNLATAKAFSIYEIDIPADQLQTPTSFRIANSKGASPKAVRDIECLGHIKRVMLDRVTYSEAKNFGVTADRVMAFFMGLKSEGDLMDIIQMLPNSNKPS